MADEENVNLIEKEENEVVENVTNFQDGESGINAFDWGKAWDITKKTINYSSIIAAYIGILAILSYPILHIINYFCHIDDFMKKLPLGYTSGIEEAGMFIVITLGVISIFIALKLMSWLIQRHSVIARIFCILLGGGYMYIMIDKHANEIVLSGIAMIFAIILFVFFIIPSLIVIHNAFLPIFRGIVPSVFTYYKFVFSFFPNTSGLLRFFDGAKSSVEKTNAEYAEKNRKFQEEYERKNQEDKAEYERKKEIEKQERETISSAAQNGNFVNVYGLKGNILFSRAGTLRGYTSSTVSIEVNGFITTYNGRGSIMHTRAAR